MGATTEHLRTGWEDATPSADTVTLAAVRAMADRAVDWARAAGGRVRREPGLVLADAGSPVPFFNVALSVAALDATSARTVGEYFPADRAFVVVSPHPTPDLRPAGLDLMGHPPFMVRPAGGAEPAPAWGVSVSEVRDPDTLADWDRVLAEGFPLPRSPAPAELLGGPTRFWLARRNGEPVAASLSHTAHGVVDVEAVAVLPGHRGRGIGTTVTWAATTADPTLPAVLTASDHAVSAYRRMGYVPVTRWTIWFRPSRAG